MLPYGHTAIVIPKLTRLVSYMPLARLSRRGCKNEPNALAQPRLVCAEHRRRTLRVHMPDRIGQLQMEELDTDTMTDKIRAMAQLSFSEVWNGTRKQMSSCSRFASLAK